MSKMPDPAAFDVSEVKARFGRLGRVGLLSEVKQRRGDMKPEDMRKVVDHAATLLSEYYVHLPLKRNLYGADPLQQLRILRSRIDAESAGRIAEADFHREMTAIFVSLRDLHTNYTLPEPYRRRIAFLPFLVESCVADDGRTPRFLVTKTSGDGPFSDPDFSAGTADDATTQVEVTHWNGMPIERAVALNGARSGGSNAAARRARGLDRLTFRWLGRVPVPDEDWVVVTYEVAGETRHLSFPWLVVVRTGDDVVEQPTAGRTRGLDREGEWIGDSKRKLFARPPGPGGEPLHPATDELREAFGYWTKEHPDGRVFGYLRIYSFVIDERPGLLEAIRDALDHRVGDEQRPVDGLIIDIRGNPGGDVPLAEQVLQAISPVSIESEVVEFINTPRSLSVADDMHRDVPGPFPKYREEALATGAQYIRSLEIDPVRQLYPVDQVYQGPVALIIDALSYSAADVFAAGFEDHRLGGLIGTDPQTGGGGGNIWIYEEIQAFDRSLPKKLPHDASFDVAVRRTRRVGRGAGVTLEDRGVLAGSKRPLRTADVLGRNEALIEGAMNGFDQPELQPRSLACSYDSDARRFTLRAAGLSRVDAFIDERPVGSLADPDGKHVRVARGAPDPTTARFEGYVSRFAHASLRVTLNWLADPS